jgi:carbon monoxide dehydrogenase subunit G
MSLTIKTNFSVPHAPDLVWPALIDIETSAPCFPGAQLKERLPDGSYKGVFTVKLGPMTFAFNGKFRILQQDDVARTALIEADGTDAQGRGGAKAQVQLALADGPDDRSEVSVISDVTLSGAVAQYGRGVAMIEALSRQLLAQFSRNLAAKISALPPQAAAAPEARSAQAAPAVQAQVQPPSHALPAQPVPLATEAAAPLDAGALVGGALWESIKRFFAKVFGAAQRQ